MYEGPVLNKNMPRVAGILKWSQELRDRVNSSMDKLRSLDTGYGNNIENNFAHIDGSTLCSWYHFRIAESADALLVFSKHDEMMKLITE